MVSKSNPSAPYLDDKALIEEVRAKRRLSTPNHVALACAIDPSLVSAVLKGKKGLGPKARLKLWVRLGAPWAKTAFAQLYPDDEELMRALETI